MAYSSITNPRNFMNTVLYTGNSTDNRSITGLEFQPDWVWIKERGATNSHSLFDAVRGANKQLQSNANAAQYDFSGDANQELKSFTSDGFTLGTGGGVNNNSDTYVAWNWKAGTGQGSSNTDGSINTTYTSVNTTAGFSISKYTGNSTTGATVGHGLGATPKMIIIKSLGVENWEVYHASLGNTQGIYLNETNAAFTTSARWNNTSPTNSVWTMGNTSAVNASGVNYIAYCFAEKQGYSKFGSYTGNGNANGPFIFTGFKPAWIIVKKTSGSGSWWMRDNKIAPFNVASQVLIANSTGAETSGVGQMDFLSNGFKLRDTTDASNSSGGSYIYMAFAEEPLVASNFNVATAR